MRFEIIVAPEAARALRSLSACHRKANRDALKTHLRYEPMKTSKRRIKRLGGLSRPQYRLRIDGFLVFYDIIDQEVQVLAIVSKAEAEIWLESYGTPEA